MDKAKAAVSDFMNKSGKHDTTVHEKVAPGVVHENVTQTRYENVQTAVDKEIHQDHYHTSVQPVHDREILPEKHAHNMVGVEHRSFEHGDARADEERLAREAGQFRDERVVGDTKHTHSVAPAVAGEHIHHHVHETIQPVVQKETIQPSVVHTTVPIHETHHNAAQHHSTSALPAVSMSDFKRQGGVLTGREERYDGFEGEPKSVGGALSGSTGSSGLTSGTTGHHGTTGHESLGDRARDTMETRDPGMGSTGRHHDTTADTSAPYGDSMGNTDPSGRADYGNTSSTGYDNSAQKKGTLLDKMNPKVDSNNDGKAGFMK